MNEQQAKELFEAAVKWQEQGARSKWKSKTSLELWDTVERIKKEKAENPDISFENLVQALLRKAWWWVIREWGWPSSVA